LRLSSSHASATLILFLAPLDLLGAPSAILRVPHVRRGLNLWEKFERAVANANNANNASGDDLQGIILEHDAADKDVD